MCMVCRKYYAILCRIHEISHSDVCIGKLLSTNIKQMKTLYKFKSTMFVRLISKQNMCLTDIQKHKRVENIYFYCVIIMNETNLNMLHTSLRNKISYTEE